MAKNAKQTAIDILEIIGSNNVETVSNCLTRLRLNLKPDSNVNVDELKKVKDVMGVLTPSLTELQVVLGPGFVNSVTKNFKDLINSQVNITSSGLAEIVASENKSAAEVAKEIKAEFKQKNKRVQTFFTKFSKIFSPMIIGFIGAGILSGIAGIIQSAYGGSVSTANASAAVVSWYNILGLLLNIWKNAFIIIVGWRTSEVFGGSGVLGAMAACLYSPAFQSQILPILITNNANGTINFMGIYIADPLHNWLTVGFYHANAANVLTLGTPSGNILGALLTASAAIWIEKGIRRFMPGVLDTIVTPTATLFFLLLVNFFLLIPISGYLYTAVSFLFAHLYTNPFGAFVLASIFLIAVAFGVHQGFVPIYAILIAQTGVNGLFPILGMAGMAQFGTGLALMFLSKKDSDLRKQTQGALIPAFFGIGEPMIYGVTLPRIKPFVTASIAAGFGGFFIGAVYLWGHVTFGLNSMFGPSGILAAFMMTTASGNIALGVSIYLIGCLISIIAGVLITMFAYSQIVVAGTEAMKKIFKGENTKQKILLSLILVTIIGAIVYCFTSYFAIPKSVRKENGLMVEVN